MLIACLFHARIGSVARVEHWERNKIMTETDSELTTATWPEDLQANTEFKYDWSYIVALDRSRSRLIASILFSLAAVCIRTDRRGRTR